MAEELQQVLSRVANKGKSEEKKVSKTVQLIVFELDSEEYGLIITDVREILNLEDVTPIPNAPDFIRGILNVRGTIVVVVDLEKKFKLKRENKVKAKHVILTEVEESTFGVIVDKVVEVMTVDETNISQAPELVSSKIHTDYLRGVVVIDEKNAEKKDDEMEKGTGDSKKKNESRLIILIDIKKLLQSKELIQLGSEISKMQEHTN